MKKTLWIVLAVLLIVALLAGGAIWYITGRMQAAGTTVIEAKPEDYDTTPAPEVIDFSAQSTPVPDAATPTFSSMPIYSEAPIEKGIVNILLVGGDSLSADASGDVVQGNADAIMLVSLNKETKVLTMVSFMRDSYLNIVFPKGAKPMNKLNAAYSNGGIGMLINTLNYNYKLDIQQYAAVSFNGFVKLVDKIGGITVDVDERERTWINAYIDRKHLPYNHVKDLGLIQLDGGQTLLYVRNRSTGVDGATTGNDSSRVSRQQEVFQIIYDKVCANPLGSIEGLITFAVENVATNVELSEMFSLASYVVSNHVTFKAITVPYAGTWRAEDMLVNGSSASVVTFNLSKARAQLKADLYPEN